MVRLPVVVVAAMLASIVVGLPLVRAADETLGDRRPPWCGCAYRDVRRRHQTDRCSQREPQIANGTLVTTVLYPARKVSGGDPSRRGARRWEVSACRVPWKVPVPARYVRAVSVAVGPRGLRHRRPQVSATGEDTPGGPLPDDYVNEPAYLGVVMAGLVRLAHDKHSLYEAGRRSEGRRGGGRWCAAVTALGYNDCCI